MKGYFPSISDQTDNIPKPGASFYNDWTGTLSTHAHIEAVKNFCNAKGYDYLPPDKVGTGSFGECTYNEATCKSDSNPHWVSCHRSIMTGPDGSTSTIFIDGSGKSCNPEQKPYLEWHPNINGKGACLVSTFPPSFITNVCEAHGLGEWYQGTPECDATGYCQLNPDDAPTCKLEHQYCERMGMDFRSGKNDQGDCYINDTQNIFEGIFGKTATRLGKRNFQLMTRECHHHPFSANCALAIGQFAFTDTQILYAAADKELKMYMDDLKTKCSGNIYKDLDSFEKCGGALLGFSVGKQVVGFADNMLTGIFGWMGLPHGLISKGLGYVGKYGNVAIKAIFHAGEKAIHAFDVAGDYCKKALDNIGLGGLASVWVGSIGNIVKFGIKMAKIIAGVAQEAIHIFAEDIVPAAYHVFHAVSDAVLHPKEFFAHVGKDIKAFISDPIGSLKNAFTEIGKIGEKVLHIVTVVLGYLKKVAGKILGIIGDQIMDVVHHIENVFKGIGHDIKKAAKHFWHALKHFF